MASDSIILSAANKISIAFDMDDVATLTTLDEIREALIHRIVELLNRNPERLMVLLYRIDVSEARVNEIFSKALPPDVPELVADLIIERQLAKAETRARGGV
ncbi:MAG: hypothetical protein SGJ05_01600 [bacterium]|nr:hypothetical protein [bacterium]